MHQTNPPEQNLDAQLTELLGTPAVPKKRGKKLFLLLGGGILLLGGAAAALFLWPKSQEAGGETVYREYTVEYGDITVGQSESSSISLNRETVTFPVSAEVLEVYVKEGSSVKAGDPLVKLDPEDIAAGLASYELQLEIAGLQLEQAKLQLETKLLAAEQQLETSREAGNLASTQEEITVGQLQSALEKAERELAKAQDELSSAVYLTDSFEEDYRRLIHLEERMEDYEDAVEELEEELADLQDDLSSTQDSQSVASDALAKAKAAWSNALTTATALEAFITDDTVDTQMASVESKYGIDKNNYSISIADNSAFLSSVQSALQTEVDLLSEDNAKAQAANTLSTLMGQLQSLDSYAYQNYAANANVAASTDERAAIQAEIEAVQEDLADCREQLSDYQEIYNEFKSEYNSVYGNAEGAEELAKRVIELEAAAEDAALALEKAQLSLTTGSTSAEHQKETAKTQASTAETTYELTEMELSQAVEAAQEEYDALADQIEEVKSLVSGDGIVYADCNGMVASISVAEGDSVSVFVNDETNQIMAYAQLLVMTNISDVYVPITISEEDILSVSIGQEAAVTMTAFPNRTFAAEVDAITVESARSGAATVSYTVNVRFSEENELDMFEGMSAEVTLVQRRAADVLYVSVQAVTNTNGTATVLKKGEDGNPVVTEVKTGFSDGRYVEILSGLSEGDVVLVESAVGRS